MTATLAAAIVPIAFLPLQLFLACVRAFISMCFWHTYAPQSTKYSITVDAAAAAAIGSGTDTEAVSTFAAIVH